MSALIIVFIILLLELLPIKSWLNAAGLNLLLPIIFTVVFLATIVFPIFGLNQVFHWYDLVIALAAFLYEWFDFLDEDGYRITALCY